MTDQLEFYNIWQNDGKWLMNVYYGALRQKINDLNLLVLSILKTNFNQELGKISMDASQKLSCQQNLKSFYEANVPRQLTLYLSLIDRT